MRCGACREAPAEILLRRAEDEDLRLCPACARAYGIGGPASAMELDLGLLLSSPIAASEGLGRRASPARCPACGSPSPNSQRSGLGCSACAASFRSELRRLVGLPSPGLFLKKASEPEHGSTPSGESEASTLGPVLETRIDCRRESAEGPFASPESQAALRSLPLPAGFLLVEPSRIGELRSRALVERGLLSSARAADPSAVLGLPGGGGDWLLCLEDEAGLRLRGRGGPSPRVLLEELFGLVDAYPEEAFAFDLEFGYLARSVRGLGWGIELGVGLCLPALAASAGLEAPFRALLAAGFEVRGRTLPLDSGAELWEGEGRPDGSVPLFEIVARPGSGSPRGAADRLASAAARLADAETEAAKRLRRRDPIALEDRLGRALGLLSSCRRLGESEALSRLATLRLAVSAGLLPQEASPPAELFSALGPASLALALGLPGLPRGLAADESRAALLGAKARSIIASRAWESPETLPGR